MANRAKYRKKLQSIERLRRKRLRKKLKRNNILFNRKMNRGRKRELDSQTEALKKYEVKKDNKENEKSTS